MLHWLLTAADTYVLHSEHGNGYAWWSAGPGPGLGDVLKIGLLVGLIKHVQCEEPGCWRLGHRHPDHGRPVCRQHYSTHKPPLKGEPK